jgi:hypothetical protein
MGRPIRAPAVVNSFDNDEQTFEPRSASDFGIVSRDFSYGAAGARSVLAMRFKIDPQFAALFVESLLEFLAYAFSFEGIEGVRVSRVLGDDWLIRCYFSSSAVQCQFAASQAYRRQVRLLREFIAQL